VDRNSRRLSHGKGSKISTQTSVPLSSDGDDGDQIMVGTTMYTKSQGRWMGFKSGGGNINDGWHGSQKYVKILPKDFYLDDDYNTSALWHYDVVGNAPANRYTNGLTAALQHPASGGETIGTSIAGMACSIPIPLGYWAIAAKIYSSHTFGPSAVPVIVYTGGNEGAAVTKSTTGVKIHNASLVDGSTSILTSAQYSPTNTRIVFDTAMLGQDSNYLYLAINGFFPTAAGFGPVIYGGYIELRRVKTAAVIAEEESSTGGDVLDRTAPGGG
jgi:hypothetical protein